jgi:predicted transposase/invertase (TIGR01784 family)
MLRNQNGRTIAEMLNVIFLELPKIVSLPDDILLLTPNQMWGKFFLYASDSEKQDFVTQLAKHNRGIQMAVTVLNNISQDEINWYRETRYWMSVSDKKSMISSAEDRGIKKGLEQGLQQGLEQGIQQGIQQAVIENAKILLADGKYTASEISKLLNVPIESFTVSE